jgi:hypothetical protein
MSQNFKLVPACMLLDKTTIGAINFHCGDGSNLTIEECSEGILWVGTVIDDDGKEVYGLHIQTAEYPEEGSTTLVEFAAPEQPVYGDPVVVAVVAQTDDPFPETILTGRPGIDVLPVGTELVDRACIAPLLAEIERLKGLQPDWPPRPPEGSGLPRYGLRWNGPQQPLAVPMDDGYWTPWHLADQLQTRVSELESVLGGMLFAFDDGVGQDWSAPLLDYARKQCTAVEYVAQAAKP